MQLIYTLQIFGVGTGSDTSLGLFDGSLKLATAPLSGYLNGVLDYKEIGDIQSSINIIEGGQLGGPTGTVSLKVRSQAIAAALNSGVLAINGKLLQIRVHPVGGTPQLLYTGTVSNSFVPDTLTIDITSASAYELDTKDVPCITVTKDMALGDASSGAIGKVLVPTYGAKVSYPLINLEPSTDAAAVAVFSSVYEDDTKVLQANAPKRQVGSPAVVTPSGEQIGVTLMIPAAAWQQAEAMPVWVALSVNGKEMLFAEASESYADLLRSQLLGKVLIAVRGKGKGTRYTIKALEYASHAGAATIWVQLDTTDIASIKAAKPYSVSSTDGLGAYRADTKYDAKASTDTIVAAYENGSIVDDLTHFAFTRAANIYLVHGDCVSPSGIYTVKDGIKQDIPGVKIVEIHRGDRWALIRIDAAHDSEGFQVDNLIGLETFLLDDSEAFNGLYANDGSVRDTVANNDQVPTGGLALECSTITPGFGVTADQVLTNYCTTFSRIEDLVDGKELSKDWTVLATPSASLYISGAWSLTYPQRATIQVQVATVGEGNVTLGSVTTEHVARFKGVPAMSVDIRPDLGAILFGAGCISHEATSTSAYRALVEGLDISDLLSAGTVKRVRGIVCTVRLRVDAYGYEHAYYTAVARKTIRPLALNLGRKVAFTDTLYASAIWGSSINSPASLCREIATKNGITVDTASFTASDNYMQGLLGGKAYEGTYTPSAGESLSSVLQTIARASGLGLYTDAQGVLHCVSLWEGAEAPVYEFGGTSLVDGSLSLSTSDTGYMSSSFSFEYVTSPYSTKLSAYIDAGTDTLPAEDDYQTGSLTYAQSNGYGVQVYDYDAGWGRVRIRAPLASADMLAPFVQGTTWELQTLTGTPRRRWIRVDSVAPDLLAPAWEQGVWIGYSVLHSEDITAPAEVSLKYKSASPRWREYVSGICLDNYVFASEMHSRARTARMYLGKSVAAGTSITKLEQPLWGDNAIALQHWLVSTVRHATSHKILARCRTPLVPETMAIPLLASTTLAWGRFQSQPIEAKVVEKTVSASDALIEWTLLITSTAPAGSIVASVLAEDGVPIFTEAGDPIGLETSEGEKISDMPESSIAALIGAGASVPAAIADVANRRFAVADLVEYGLDKAKQYTDSQISERGNRSQTLVAGKVGDTSISVRHSLETKDLVVTVRDASTDEILWLGVTITDTQVAIDDLAPLTAPFKIVLAK